MARLSLLLLGVFIIGASSAKTTLHLRVGNFYQPINDSDHSITLNMTLSDPAGETTVNFTGLQYGEYSAFKNVSVPPNAISCWTISVHLSDNDESPKKIIDEEELNLDPTASWQYHSVTVYGGSDANLSAAFWVNNSLPDISPLGIDQALFVVYNHLPYPLEYSELSSNCYKCIPNLLDVLYPGGVAHIIADTTFSLTYYFNCTKANQYNVTVQWHFVEHSITELVINDTTPTHPTVTVLVEGDNAYLPILYASIVIIGLFVIIYASAVIYHTLDRRGLLHWRAVDRAFDKDMGDPKKVYNVNSTEQSPLLNGEGTGVSEKQSIGDEGNKELKKQRLKSLDTFRGLSLVIMIFVNYGGGGYWFFAHSKWNGITVADLVFPWFVWIMGVSVVFSFRGRRSDTVLARLYQIIRRSVILMGLGLFLNNGADLSRWRIPGVLQRFAISYFVVAITELLTSPVYGKWKIMWRYAYLFRDITSNWIQLVLVLLLEALWLAITFCLPVQGCPTGYLGPGGLGDYGNYPNCTGGAAGYIDRIFFTTDHIYDHPTSKKLYQSCAYDPEGLLGSINSIVICFLGVQAGRIITYHSVHWQRLLRFLIWGVVLSVVATALCEASKNDGLIPLNKNLWSLSFILLMAGTGFLLLAFLYFIVDVLKVWQGAPFVYPGMNSILVYVGSELLEEYFPFSWSSRNTSHLEMLSSNLVGVSVWLLLAFYWYWIKFFVKI